MKIKTTKTIDNRFVASVVRGAKTKQRSELVAKPQETPAKAVEALNSLLLAVG